MSGIVGLWSRDSMYGPGSQSDEILFLFPDGTGRLDIDNPLTVNALTFRWTLEDEMHIRIVGEQCYWIAENPTRVAAKGWEYNKLLAFAVQEEDTRSGRRMHVLRFEQPIVEWVPKEFGFCGENIEAFRSPDFSWVTDMQRGYLGVYFSESRNDHGGAVICGVVSHRTADKAGIEAGDIVRRVDDIVVSVADDLRTLVQNWKPNQVVTLEIVRGGETLKREVRLIDFKEWLSLGSDHGP